MPLLYIRHLHLLVILQRKNKAKEDPCLMDCQNDLPRPIKPILYWCQKRWLHIHLQYLNFLSSLKTSTSRGCWVASMSSNYTFICNYQGDFSILTMVDLGCKDLTANSFDCICSSIFCLSCLVNSWVLMWFQENVRKMYTHPQIFTEMFLFWLFPW